jgi:cytochrome c
LAGVVGRAAGSAPAYPYSAALKNAGFKWTDAKLSEWLADPQKMVPGTAMELRVPEAQARQDVIAYLKAPSPMSE